MNCNPGFQLNRTLASMGFDTHLLIRWARIGNQPPPPPPPPPGWITRFQASPVAPRCLAAEWCTRELREFRVSPRDSRSRCLVRHEPMPGGGRAGQGGAF